MRRKLLRAVSFVGCLLLSCLSSNLIAQHVAKITIPKVKATVTTPAKKPAALVVPQKKVPDSTAQKAIAANKLIAQIKKDLLVKNPAATIKIDTIPVSKDSAVVVDSAALTKAVKDSADAAATVAGSDTATASTTEDCAKLKDVVNLDLDKTVNGEYIFSLVDKKDNPISTFTLKQFNESLFMDQLKKALSGLCTVAPLAQSDSLYVVGLINEFTKQKLYDRMLEASLEVNDAAVYAGELKVFKTMPVTFEYDSAEMKKAGKDSSNKKKADVAGADKGEDKPIPDAIKKPGKDSIPVAKAPGKTGTQLQTAVKLQLMAHVLAGTGAHAVTDNRVPVANDTTGTDDSVVGNLENRQPNQKVFTAYSISIQFQDGFIENIKVLGKVAGSDRMLKFENIYPIPFSTRRDFRVLYKTCLFEKTIYNSTNENKQHVKSCRLSMGDLLFYSQQLAIDNKDYSPKNQVYNATLTGAATTINLEKEQTSKILEMLIFSDLKGIDDNSPNGLIQLELSKKFNFWNNRHRGLGGNQFNYGWLNYITPSFTMNKIEDKNRRLVPKYLGSQQQDTTKANSFASTIDLYQYQSFGIGVNLTWLTMDIPGWKSTFNFNMGAYFGRSQIEDTIRVPGTDSASFKAAADNNILHFGVNSFRFVPEVCWQVFPDPRYGIILSQKFIHYSLHSTDIRQVRDSLSYGQYLSSLHGDRSKIDAYSFKKWIGCAEIYAYFKPAEYNQVFFRYRYNWDMGNTKLNFQQVQIGLSTYLTHTKAEKTKTTPN